MRTDRIEWGVVALVAAITLLAMILLGGCASLAERRVVEFDRKLEAAQVKLDAAMSKEQRDEQEILAHKAEIQRLSKAREIAEDTDRQDKQSAKTMWLAVISVVTAGLGIAGKMASTAGKAAL
jgi:hypothetical protein